MKEIANKMIVCNIHRFLLYLSVEVFYRARFFLNFCTVFFRNFRHKIILKFLPGVTIFAHFFQMFSGYSRCMVPWNKEYLLLHQDWRGWKPRQPEGRHQPIFRSVYLSHVGEHHHLGDAPIRAFYGLYLPSFSGQQAKSGQKWGKNLWNSLIFCPFYVGEMTCLFSRVRLADRVPGWGLARSDGVYEGRRGTMTL